MSQGQWVLVVALVLATAFGLYRAARDGRFRGTHPVRGVTPEAEGAISDAATGVEDPGASPEGAAEAETGPSVLEGVGLDYTLGQRATLLQFSSAFCAPCRATRRILADVAATVPGVVHLEVHAEHHLDLVRRLGILRTPTTLVLDPGGREISRASGAPTKQAVLATLARVIAS